jgi:hypothetical protein
LAEKATSESLFSCATQPHVASIATQLILKA